VDDFQMIGSLQIRRQTSTALRLCYRFELGAGDDGENDEKSEDAAR